MEALPLDRAFTLIEPGPVVLVTTHDGQQANVMTITWTMVRGFAAEFAITTGPWNHSYAALRDTGECVLAIPTVDLLDLAVGIGTCSGADTDKFRRFALTALPGRHVQAPLIRECLANIECRVTEIIERHSLVLLEGVAAWVDGARKERRTLHAVGDGTFIVDGRRLDRREMMRAKPRRGSRCRCYPAGRRTRSLTRTASSQLPRLRQRSISSRVIRPSGLPRSPTTTSQAVDAARIRPAAIAAVSLQSTVGAVGR
ncbi:MAG: flavin reductase family protein [Geminicoccaceae bacterium]